MTWDIVTLTPFNQVNSGGYDPNVNPVDLLRGPDVFGGGSVSDDSDTSYVEIGTRYDGTQPDGQEDQPDLFLVDFALDATAHPNPTWAYISIRAKNVTPAGDPVWETAIPYYGLYRTDDLAGRFITYQQWPFPLQRGEQTGVAWFDQAYSNSPILPGEPGDATNWLNLPRDWPTLLDPLTTTGLRVGFYCYSQSVTRKAVLDLYEVRLVVACGATIPVTFTPAPPARLSGRMDGAFHGARRMDTRGPSRRGGFRPGGYY